MDRPARATRHRWLLGAVAIALVLGDLGSTALAGAAPARTARHRGTVNVLYAASLQSLMQNIIGPRFDRATGYSFSGYSGASGTLANEEKAGTVQGDVFISASPTVNTTLQGAANGDWVRWYAAFASSPLVIGYNPKSRYAAGFKTRPWYQAVTRPGILIGRTDPSTDPKGKLTVQAIVAAEQVYNDPSLASVVASPANEYPEQTLVGLLQSGQLDAGFFYASEAKAAGIPTVGLRKLFLAATYTVAPLAHAPDPAGADAFVAYLLGRPGRALLKQEGMTVLRTYRLIGGRSEVPPSLRGIVAPLR